MVGVFASLYIVSEAFSTKLSMTVSIYGACHNYEATVFWYTKEFERHAGEEFACPDIYTHTQISQKTKSTQGTSI